MLQNLDPGSPDPLGVSRGAEMYNFAIFSREAKKAVLCLFDRHFNCLEIPLDPHINKTGDIWHVQIKDLNSYIYYGYKFDDQSVVLDPYAKGTSTTIQWGASESYLALGIIARAADFDWSNVERPRLPWNEMIIYELHVRGFTIHPSSGVSNPGTFLGLIEKIPHLVEMGINAVELMPMQEFNENEVKKFPNPAQKDLFNYWGYSTVNFFSPMNRYAASSEINAAIVEFKTMVRELHRHGIEVILDMVFNHTAEGSELGPMLSFKGIDPSVYYLHDEDGKLSNYSGCGNTLNCNHPIVRKLILDCLVYWHLEMGVDGFRFDLTSVFMRGRSGEPVVYSPLVEEMTEHPLLKEAKLIAEPWDAVGLYHVGQFACESRRWSEWNGKFRDTVRRYIKGTREHNIKGIFITRICGSEDLYHANAPQGSVNFVTAHDGFTLCDLVSYNHKHNKANGEDNRDGFSHNDSWNCGAEGETEDKAILALRERQMRNFHVVTLISQGIPMLLMGDEYAHTKQGNNNTWCQDNELNWFLWNRLKENGGFYRFYCKLIHFRKVNPLLKRKKFLTPSEVEWHGLKPTEPDWHGLPQFAAYTLLDEENEEHLFIVFNTDHVEHSISLPKPPEGKNWHWIVNTSNQSPEDFFESPSIAEQEQKILPYTSWILKAM